jgi:hypothetical protein
MALTGFIGKVAFRKAIQSIVSEPLALENLAEELMEKLEQQAEQRPRVLGVESDTWYTFRMADERYWVQANQFLSDQMDRRVSAAYNDVVGRASVPPFALSVTSSNDGVSVSFRKSPRSTGFDAGACRAAAVNAVRESMRAYVRMAAAGIPIEE